MIFTTFTTGRTITKSAGRQQSYGSLWHC